VHSAKTRIARHLMKPPGAGVAQFVPRLFGRKIFQE
jgi:hypothetical protein